MAHIWRSIMEEHRASIEAYKKVHEETVRSGLRMEIMQQSMEMNMWDIKEKLAERREQMAIRAYEVDKRREEWIQKIEEDKRLDEWIQKIEEDKRRDEWIQKIEEVINLIQSFIRNPISPVKTPQPMTTKVPAVTTTVPAKPIQNSPCYDDLTSDQNKKITKKGVGKKGFGCALNRSKGSHLGLRHCAANRKRKKRKGPFVWTKSKSRVVIEVGKTKAIDGLTDSKKIRDMKKKIRDMKNLYCKKDVRKLKNLLLSLIQKSSSPVQSSRPITTKVPRKPTECAPGDFGCLSPNNMTDFEEDEKEFENTISVAKEDKDEAGGKEEKGC
ncbi:hypothetical protein Tco_0424494 [Tanacetum coccineum]